MAIYEGNGQLAVGFEETVAILDFASARKSKGTREKLDKECRDPCCVMNLHP